MSSPEVNAHGVYSEDSQIRTLDNGGSARAYLADSLRERSGHHGHPRHDSERARIFMQTVVSRWLMSQSEYTAESAVDLTH